MIEEIAPNLFRVEVPLPIPVVGSMNSYIITDPDRNLVIDPGMADPLCFDAMHAALAEIGLDLRKTDFFVTHHHLDHFGLVSQLMADGSEIYINHEESVFIERIASQSILSDLGRLFITMGFPEKDPMNVISEMLGDEYRAPWPFCCLSEGDLIEKGGYHFRCVVTPGHSGAHTCLYESDAKILIAGDAISPVLQFVSDEGNPLGSHLQSLDRLRQTDADLVLPGHRFPFRDHCKRIDMLKTHHLRRTEAILDALGDSGKTTYEVAISLHQAEANSKSWESLSLILKFIAARDVFAHLRYMEVENRVQKEQQDGCVLYTDKTL